LKGKIAKQKLKNWIKPNLKAETWNLNQKQTANQKLKLETWNQQNKPQFKSWKLKPETWINKTNRKPETAIQNRKSKAETWNRNSKPETWNLKPAKQKLKSWKAEIEPRDCRTTDHTKPNAERLTCWKLKPEPRNWLQKYAKST
jgi:hypothetical protein